MMRKRCVLLKRNLVVLAEEASSIILRLDLKGQVTFFNKFAQNFWLF